MTNLITRIAGIIGTTGAAIIRSTIGTIGTIGAIASTGMIVINGAVMIITTVIKGVESLKGREFPGPPSYHPAASCNPKNACAPSRMIRRATARLTLCQLSRPFLSRRSHTIPKERRLLS
jgi:hypothetical protein